MQPLLNADIAVTISVAEAENLDWFERTGDRGNWTGWQRHHWPADIIHPGLRVYAFDTRPDRRRLCMLLEIEEGESFQYVNKREFIRNVQRITGWSRQERDPHFNRIPRGSAARPCTGIALTYRLIKRVNIDIGRIRFPQIGWLKLAEVSDIDSADIYYEGGGQLREHFVIERNAKLRTAAKNYWRRKMGGTLHCLACKFDFAKKYGERGEDFIEMHHTRLVASARRKRGVRREELEPVCSNCHRMIHRRPSYMLTIKEVRAALR